MTKHVVRMRLYENGELFALTEAERDAGNTIEDVAGSECEDLAFREFDVELTADLPVRTTVAVTVPPERTADVTATAAA